MFQRLACAMVLAVGLFAIPSSSGAQPDKDQKEFKERLAEGLDAYKKENYEEALEAFRHAEKIASPPLLQYNIARTFQKMGRCVDAREQYQRVMEMENVSDKYRARSKKYRGELMERCPPTGTVRITCRPKEARVTVEGAGESKACPASFELEPDSYTVTVEAEGYQASTVEVDVEWQESTERNVELVEAPTAQGGDWRKYVAYGGLAVGAGLLTLGGIEEMGTAGRLERLQSAIDAGDGGRGVEVRREARASRTRAAIFYAAGGLVTAGAGTLLVYELVSGGKTAESARVQPTISPKRVGVRVVW